ncbi:MAG TPA: hypothetical protein VFW92_03185 [Candidatus Limnocylindrales bacterium]|nr:hypothetical protein [Candidatus Limnocylindrales bacterium]
MTDGPTAPRVRDRQVVIVATIVVVAVLGTQLISIVYPPLDDLLGFQPAVAVFLVVVTAWILAVSIRAARRG